MSGFSLRNRRFLLRAWYYVYIFLLAMINFLRRRDAQFIFLLLIVGAISVLLPISEILQKQGAPNEIGRIKQLHSVSEQAPLYEALIKRVGPVQAQEDLLHSGLPFDGQTHLLNHTVGTYLYKTYGAKGLTYCKDYFLSSCYHGFVLNAIAKGGSPEIQRIIQECAKHGSAVLGQCAHALGHGLLAFAGYASLLQALEGCDEAGQQSPGMPLFNCYDGVFMENVWGIHDGQPSPDRWVKPQDPLYPCNDARIPSKYLPGCWSNQPSLMYQLFNSDITRVGQECLQVKNSSYQQICFDGLARQIHPLVNGNADQARQLCSLLPSPWPSECLSSIARAAFSVGDRNLPSILCAFLDGAKLDACYAGILAMASLQEQASLCASLTPAQRQQFCPSGH